MYRLYAQKLEGSYEKIAQKKEIQDIQKIANKLTSKEYYSYMIIKNDGERR